MKYRHLAMPAFVQDFIHMPLTRMGLRPTRGDDLVACPLMYENGTELALLFQCVARRGWFRQRSALLVSLFQFDREGSLTAVFLRNTVDCPSGPGDLQFLARLPRLVKVMAWTHAATGAMGECVALPRPSR